MTTLFVTGIDTDIGKSFACGVLAKTLLASGCSLFTQKLVETGCDVSNNHVVSNDLIVHQKIVGYPFNKASATLHCPYMFSYPASPHLAAKKEGKKIDCDYLVTQIKELEQHCDHLLIEGAGGLCVPLTQDTLLVDFIAENHLPIVLVTSAKLGSINHTLLSLYLCQNRNIEIRAVIYNHYGQDEKAIVDDTREVIQSHLRQKKLKPVWLELEDNSLNLTLSLTQQRQLLV